MLYRKFKQILSKIYVHIFPFVLFSSGAEFKCLENSMKDQDSNKQKFYIYTDGSYRSGVYSGAFCVYAGTRLVYHDSGCGTKAASMNNVAGELSAVMHAALWLKKNNSRAVIVHDYEGCSKWLNGQWRAKNEYTKAYVSFMKPYVNSETVSFKWVKGHNGDLGNAIADVKARKALKEKKSWCQY